MERNKSRGYGIIEENKVMSDTEKKETHKLILHDGGILKNATPIGIEVLVDGEGVIMEGCDFTHNSKWSMKHRGE